MATQEQLLRLQLINLVNPPGGNKGYSGPGSIGDYNTRMQRAKFLQSPEYYEALKLFGQDGARRYMNKKLFGTAAGPMPYGQQPTEQMFKDYINEALGRTDELGQTVNLGAPQFPSSLSRMMEAYNQMGGNALGMGGYGGGYGGGSGYGGYDGGNPFILNLLEEAEKQREAANAANEARYQEIKTSKNKLRDRALAEAENWGATERRNTEEASRRELNRINANLAARGLGNSTITGAFDLQAKRNLRDQLVDLSERKSARTLGYDIDLTKDRDAFIERKTENAPDYNTILSLAKEYGNSLASQPGGYNGGYGGLNALMSGGFGGGLGSALQASNAGTARNTPWGPLMQASTIGQIGGVTGAGFNGILGKANNYVGEANRRFMTPTAFQSAQQRLRDQARMRRQQAVRNR